ncbi:MAG TPA: O-antigen ligase family protein [Chitinophagaceae bacterium]|nr:O-antigen ligase family protein [Chitinophagaceae bacterium]
MNTLAPSRSIPFALLSVMLIDSLAMAIISEQLYWIILPFSVLLFMMGWKSGRFIFFLLLFSIPFSFEYNFTPDLGTDIPDEGLMLMASLIFVGYWLYNPSSVDRKTWLHPIIILLLIHFCWIALTTVLSSNPVLSLKYLLAKSWYLGAFVLAPIVVFKNRGAVIISSLIRALSVLAVAIIALIRHSQYSFDFAAINQSVAPFFRNHVNYSAMLVCMVPVFLAFYYLSKNKRIKFFLLIGILILLTALLFSYARGAWVALGTGVFAWWLIRKRLVITAFLATLFLVSVALSWLIEKDRYLRFAHDFETTVFHQDFKQHLVATYELKDVSTAERFYRWIAGIRMTRDSWLHGFGPNTFYEKYKPYTIPAYKTWVSDNKERSGVHNYFLLLVIEQGIPGLFFFLLLIGCMLYYAQYLYHNVSDPFYKTVALTTGVIIVMLSTLNFLSDLVETDKVGSIFFLCLSLLVRATQAPPKSPS